MKNVSSELKVGVFALIVLGVLAFMTFQVGYFERFRSRGYTVGVSFEDVAGLDRNTKVKIAGVDAGAVEKIELRDGTARVTLRIRPEVVLYSDAVASIRSSGLLGDRYLSVRSGNLPPVLADGDEIRNVEELVDIDLAVRKLTTIADSLSRLTGDINEVFGTEESKEALRVALKNLKSVTGKLDVAISENDLRMRATLDNIDRLARSLQDVVDRNREPLTETVANMREFTGTLKEEGPELVKNIRETTDSLRNISSQVEKGEGTLGKLVQDDKLYTSLSSAAEGLNTAVSSVERFKTFITFQGEYLSGVSDSKGYFSVTFQPRPEQYYILGVVSDPIGKLDLTKTETVTDGVTTYQEKKEYEREFEFTAQFARRFKDTALRVGMTESSLGFGIDQFFLDDRLKVTSDAWDFQNDEEDAKNPHVKIGAEYFFFRKLFLSAGYDNIFNSNLGGVYLGAGARFEDEDFKYLFGAYSRMPMN